MKAFVCSQITDNLSGTGIEEIERPTLRSGEVLVRIRASSVNFPDILMCQGKYQFVPEMPFTPGMDLAGEVVETAEDVSGFSVGDRVCGGTKTGGFAEFAAVPERALRLIPDSFDYAQAAAYGAAYLTAYVALVCRGHLQAGETLLVHGASGGVGMAAVDVGKTASARRSLQHRHLTRNWLQLRPMALTISSM